LRDPRCQPSKSPVGWKRRRKASVNSDGLVIFFEGYHRRWQTPFGKVISKTELLMSIDFEKDESETGSGEDCQTSTEDGVRSHPASGAWEIEDVEPWTEPVDGNALLNELQEVIKRYVV